MKSLIVDLSKSEDIYVDISNHFVYETIFSKYN